MKIKAIAFVTVTIIVLTVASAWQAKSRGVLAGVRDIAAAEIAAAAGISVRLGEIEAVSLNSIVVRDVNVYDKEAKLIASSPKVSVDYSLLSLFLGKKADMVKSVYVDQPQLFIVQKTGGRWNFEDLIADTSTAKTAFAGKVTLINGRAEVNAMAGKWDLHTINGSLDFSNQLSTGINLSAVYNESPLAVTGSLNNGGDGVFSIKARGLVLSDFAAFLPQDSSVQLVDGRAESLEATIRKANGEISFAGQAELKDAAADISGLAVRGVNGLTTFTNERVYIFAKALVAGQPVAVKGKAEINTGLPVLDLKVSSEGFDPTALSADLPLKGRVAFDASVTGAVDALAISGDFHLPDGEISGINIKNLSAKLHLADNMLTIKELNGGVAGGQLTASGVIGLTNNQYQLRIKGSGLDTVLLGTYFPGLNGRVDIDIAAAGTGTNLAGATVYGTAAMNGGVYQDIAFNNSSTSFYLANGQATIDYLNIGLEGGSLTVSGTASRDSLNLTATGWKVPLGLLNSTLSGINAEGEADFTGTVGGTADRPAIALQFNAVNGQAFCQPFAQAQGKVEVTPDIVTLTDVELVNGPTTHRVVGTIGLKDDIALNLTINSRRARAENIVKLIAPGENLTGNVDNDLILTGSLNNLNAKGHIKLTDGSFRGRLIASADGAYRRENGLTNISDFVINSLNTAIKISGVMNSNQELNFAIGAQNLDIASLRLNLPYPLIGKADFTGQLTGTPAEPLFSGQLTADSLVFKDREIKKVSGDITASGDAIEIPRFSFVQGGGTYNFSGRLNLEQGNIFGGLDVDKGDLAALFSILNIPAKEVSGQVNGRVSISGTTSRPNISLTGNITGGKIKHYLLDSVEVDAGLENNVITVNKFTAKQGTGDLVIRGTADLNGPLDFEAGGRDIDAGLLSALFNVNTDIKGKLNFAAQVSGTAANPHADISLEIASGGVGSAAFDSLYGLFILNNHDVNINQLLLTKGPYRASAYGSIPVAALSSEGRRQATPGDQMNVKVRLDQANLSILPLLTNEVSWASGATQGELSITGTVAQPYLSGSVSVKDGILKMAKLNDPIQKVDLDIQFKGDKIVLKTFSGRMGSGSYQMTGDATLDGLAFSDYNFQLNLDKLGVNSKYFKGPLNGNLVLTTGKKGRPLLSGKLLFEHDTIDIPFVADLTQSDLNLGLDLELVAGDKVRFYNSYMYDIWAEGRVKFEGSTKWPNPSGQINAIRGTVSYLRTQFKIKEGNAQFQFGTFLPTLRLKASTQLHDTTVNLDINGPVSAMDLQLTSEPAMSQQEIISLLTLRSRYFEKQNSGSGASGSGFGRDEVVGLLDAGLQMRFVSEVESVFRDAFGLDDFRVVRDTLWSNSRQKTSSEDREMPIDREVYNIEMGKYVTDRLMLNYTMGIDYDQHSFGFRYDLNRKISLTGSIDNQNDRRLGIETRFRF